MSLTKTPLCDFGKKADDFELISTDNKLVNTKEIKGEKGLLIMFICNHCPYVIAVIKEIVKTCDILREEKINSVAIMSNDPKVYSEDSFENMILFARKYDFNFPYLIDKDQSVANKYKAVCTPDFFGFNDKLELQYRGRIRGLNDLKPIKNSKNELLDSMIEISKTGKGPEIQHPSMGCSIKWFN